MELKAADEQTNQVMWLVLDARKSIDELSVEIQELADKVIAEADSKEIDKLWMI
jgi:hypothetical protein